MSAEIVDYLLIFWIVLAIVVYVLGNIYDKQLQDNKRRKSKTPRRYSSGGTNLDDLSWSATSGSYGAASNKLQATNNSALYHSVGPMSSGSAWTGRVDDSSCYQQPHQEPYARPNPYDDLAYGLPSYGGAHRQSMGDQRDHQQQVRNGTSSHQFGLQRDLAGQQDFGGTVSSAAIPTATGFNSDCVEWVNAVLYLFYTQPEKYGPIISENVYRSLNEKLYNLTSSSSEHAQLLIEFTNINAHDSTRPELTNIRTESESDKSISASCKIYNRRLNFSLSIRRLTGDTDEPLKCYELILENLEGKLKSMAMLNEKLIVIQFIDKPDTKITLRQLVSPTAHLNPYDSNNSQLISDDTLVQLVLQSITQVVVDLYFGNDIDFPQYKHHGSAHSYASYKNKLNSMIKGSASELKRQIKHDLFGAISPSSDHKERKVFVKIIRAANINYNQSVTCLMELDTPKQQAISSTKQGSDPYWDEHYLFTINERSSELVLELWDSINPVALNEHRNNLEAPGGSSSLKRNQSLLRSSTSKSHKANLVAGAKFLGLARVSIEDLRKNPVQKVSLALQPLGGVATDLSDSVGGELQLELLFMEHTASGTQTSTNLLPTSGPLHKSNSLSSLTYHQGDIVSIDRKLTPSGFVITTTTITKQPANSKQQQPSRQQDHLLTARNQSPQGSASMATEHSFDEMNFDGVSSSQMSAAVASNNAASGQDRRSEGQGAGSSTGGRLSRSRSRSRSFIRAIKKRFSFSRTRSRSVGESGAPSREGNQSPMDYETHSRASSEVSTGEPGGRAKSVPTSRDPNEVPTIVINKGRLSSDTASAFTFTHPKSQLVYEVLEPGLPDGASDGPRRSSAGRYRYYAVRDDQASQRKWRKRGLKLHVFNEHQFIACHLAGSSTCHLCGRVFSRRPGKQGYKCRNCHLLSHKQCHVKVDHNCPYAKRNGLKLEYIDADPPASLADELMLNQESRNASPVSSVEASTHQQQPQSGHLYQRHSSAKTRARPSLRTGAKSISVEVDDR